jgi:8-oxo-dGTP pyrophosphatase MutT (NUDIX family)
MSDYIWELRKVIGTRPIIMCGANTIILDEIGRILLHHRTDNDTWGLPGGVMELGESLEEAAIRETNEEVGLSCANLKLFNIYSGKDLYYKYPDGNEVYNVTATYICKDYSGQIVVDKTEGKDARFFKINEIPNKISPPVKVIIDDFILNYENIIAKHYKK